MARINVEDSILTDQRFINLTIKLGSAQYALGLVVWAWRIAQKYYLTTDNDRCIPFDEWMKQGCDDRLIETGLAEKREKGVWLIGANEQFAWLLQKQNAGEKSGKVRKTKSNSQNERPFDSVERPSTGPSGSEPLISYLSSLYSFLNTLNSFSSVSVQVREQFLSRVYDEVWPRKTKKGKSEGIAILLKELFAAPELAAFLSAAVNYIDYCAINGVENQYSFATFAKKWKSWKTQSAEVA